MVYNLMTCQGFVNQGFLGDCSISWLILAVLVFVILIVRRQCDDGVLSGINFNFIGACAFGLGACLIVITFFGSPRWAILAGLIGIGIGGYVGGLILGGDN